jgi:hypothetical protein
MHKIFTATEVRLLPKGPTALLQTPRDLTTALFAFLATSQNFNFFPHLRNGALVHSRVTDTGYYMNTEYIVHRPGFSQTQRFGNWDLSVIRNKGIELGWNVPIQLGPTVRGSLSRPLSPDDGNRSSIRTVVSGKQMRCI